MMAAITKLGDAVATVAELFAAAERLRPLVAKHAEAAEGNCDLSQAVIDALRN